MSDIYTSQSSNKTMPSVTIDGHFSNYIYQATDSDFFIANIILTPYSYKSLKQYVNDKGLLSYIPKDMTLESCLTKNLVVSGNSETFKKDAADKLSEYTYIGKLNFNEKYQRFQLDLIFVFEKIPSTPDGMVHFLTKHIETIGKTTAKKIVSHFSVENIESIFNNTPEKLLEVHGIKESQLDKIKTSWHQCRSYWTLMNFLKQFDIDESNCSKIYKAYKDKAIEFIQKNPYHLCTQNGISFATADNIAMKMDSEKYKNSPLRMNAGIRYALHETISNSGNTVIKMSDLLRAAKSILKVSVDELKPYIKSLKEEGKLVATPYPIYEDDKLCFDNSYGTGQRNYLLEKNIFDLIIELVSTTFSKQLMTEAYLEEFEKTNEFKLDQYQLSSVLSIFKHKFNILTGGPGTGKTHTVKAILSAYERAGLIVSLLAPTGKASQRLTQSTGRQAETLHRFLKLLPEEQIVDRPNLNDTNNDFLDVDLLIIDESSMLDLYVIYQCLKRINPMRTGILFVGDINQLPPVGMGYFFRDIIESGLVNVCRLEHVHRMSEDSSVYQNAYNLMHNKPLELDTTKDFEFIRETKAANIEGAILEIYSQLLEDGNSPLDIQVLSPIKDGILGVKDLNQAIRPLANPNFSPELNKRGFSFVTGDKIMQTTNNYDLMVFNGDTGMVQNYDIVKDKTIIEFGDPNYRLEEKEYDKELLKQLELAYCITIHKSQGSDYPYVILPIYEKHYYQLYVKLVYTAMTRTKKKLFIVGNKRTLSSIHDEKKNYERKTVLQTLFANMHQNKLNNCDENIFS